MAQEIKEYFKIIDSIYKHQPENQSRPLKERMKHIKFFNEFIYDGNKLIGGLTLFNPIPYVYFIEQVVVKPEYQGQGYGTELIKKIDKYKGLILLGTYLKDFYKKLGFKFIFSYIKNNKKIHIMWRIL